MRLVVITLLSSFVLFGLQPSWAQPELFMNQVQRMSIEQQRQAYLRGERQTQQAAPLSEQAQENIIPPGLVKVQSIFTVNNQPFVQINGEIFSERQQKGAIHVHRVYDDHVTLSLDGRWGRAKLGVFYQRQIWPQLPVEQIKM